MKTRTLLMMLSIICLFPGRALADRLHFFVQNNGPSTITIEMNYSGEWSGTYGPTEIPSGQSYNSWPSVEKDGGFKLSGSYNVNGEALPSSFGWNFDDPSVGAPTLKTGQPNYVTLTEPSSGQYQVNFTYAPSPVAAPGVLFGYQYMNGDNACFNAAFADSAGSFASGGVPLPNSTCNPGSNDIAAPILALAGNAAGTVIAGYWIPGGAGCGSGWGTVTATLWELPGLGAPVNFNWFGNGPISAVTPPLADGTFFVGQWNGGVVPCNQYPSENCWGYNILTDTHPITSLALDPVNNLLWIGDGGGVLYNCALSSAAISSGTIQCNQYFTFSDPSVPDNSIVSITASTTEDLIAVSTLDGYLWACSLWNPEEPSCWTGPSSLFPQPSSGGQPTVGYMNIAWANNSVYALYNWLNQCIPTPPQSADPWSYSTVISSTATPGVRAGPALFAGGDATGLATDGQNVYALADDGISLYACQAGQDGSCSQFSLNTSQANTSGWNLTVLGSVYDYVITPP